MSSVDDLFLRLSRSPFRQRFHLARADYDYCRQKGEEVVRHHAADFIKQRLAPAQPENDGKQTPMRGHPVFVAQHATATCCRGCLSKWHGIASQQPMSAAQQAYVVTVIVRWLRQEMQRPAPAEKPLKKRQTPDENRQLDLL
ncbi:DUF4186 domain-containing protein [Erwiniaceae bacterium BAC15a-03b]|uniref:DUF4186 domain-containing protein n=1 Tax=Winslowiella arboricola TaxID=2978220 RepID=A0A9J6PK86_9GAMM|nr:DUF4186 domain-containing protein [Winslowiella arboricola]MCU5772846.1 DUF4186 domain-containing protein [Winslowiella arboricola]MCU5777150.1 DUF4186 domain-containing protein [Winslowiella arboricola]